MVLAAIGEHGWMLSNPLWMLGLPVCLLPLLAARRARLRGRRIRARATGAQCLAAALVIVAMAGPKAPLRANAQRPWLVLVDASGSVRGQTCFAPPAGTATENWFFAQGLSRRRPSADAATNVAPALRLIGSGAPIDVAGAVIATDGRFTDPGWRAAAQAAAAKGIEVLIVPMDSPSPDARIVSLSAHRRSRQVELAVTVEANAPLQRTLTVRRAERAQPVLQRSLNLLPDAPATFHLSDSLPANQGARYTAVLTPADTIGENDLAEATVLPSAPTVGVFGPEGSMRAWLGAADMPIAVAARPGDLPAEPRALSALAGLVILDPTGGALSAAQRRAVGRYVESGGGLVLLGAGPSVSPADRRDPLNRVLPLVPDPFRRRPLQLIVLLDHSGSMAQEATARAGRPVQRKFDLAAEAVVALKEQLTPRDALTVITFADKPDVVYRKRGEVDVPELREALSTPPAGSTNVTPAIAKALAQPVPRGLTPMLLILSDLQSETFDPRAWAGKIHQGRDELAVVAVGQAETGGPVPPLEAMTRLAGGEYFRQEDLSGLAEVFARLVRGGRGKAIRQERTALEIVAPLFDTSLKLLPEADAYVPAGKVPSAELLAQTAGGDPVLARRRAGLGRSVCLALPLDGYNASWRSDPRVARLISAAARWAARSPNDPRLDVTVTARDHGAGVNGLSLTAEVWAETAAESAPLEQVGPGQYAGTVKTAERASALAIRDAKGATLWQEPVAGGPAREFRSIGADRQALRQLAELTGGRIVPADRLDRTVRAARARRLSDLWPILLGVALLVMLAEWSLTRVTQRRG